MSEDIFEQEETQIVSTPVETIPDKKEDVKEKEPDVDVDAILALAIDDNSYRDRARRVMERVDKKLGVRVLEKFENFEQGNLLEEIIHYMRWNPDFLFDCPLETLHKYEMVLAAHITYVKARENHWESMVKIANRDLKRGTNLAASYCVGKSLKEREARAMTQYTRLGDVEKELDMYNIYKDKCHGISETLIQMDNSLKKTLERRKFEFEYNYKGNNQNDRK